MNKKQTKHLPTSAGVFSWVKNMEKEKPKRIDVKKINIWKKKDDTKPPRKSSSGVRFY